MVSLGQTVVNFAPGGSRLAEAQLVHLMVCVVFCQRQPAVAPMNELFAYALGCYSDGVRNM